MSQISEKIEKENSSYFLFICGSKRYKNKSVYVTIGFILRRVSSYKRYLNCKPYEALFVSINRQFYKLSPKNIECILKDAQ
jgi:hypothetical protein